LRRSLVVIDCLGVPGGSALPGTTCNDGNSNTINDQWQLDCTCSGMLVTPDCEGVPGGPAMPGTPCDDGDANTGNDVYQGDCTCAGELIDCLGSLADRRFLVCPATMATRTREMTPTKGIAPAPGN
jgi:hypothetical protein